MTTRWSKSLYPGHNISAHKRHPASHSSNTNRHLVVAQVRVQIKGPLTCVWVQSVWSPGVRLPGALLAVTSGRALAYIICYGAWMAGCGRRKKKKKKTVTHRGVQVTAIHLHPYHNIKTGEAMEVP